MMKKLKLLQKIKKNTNTINIIREASEQGALFGSVTARDIAKEIKIDDIEVNAKDIIVKSVIKMGEFQVKIVLHLKFLKKLM